MNSVLNIETYRPKVLHQYIEAFKIYNFGEEENVFLLPKGVFEIVFQSQYGFQHNTNYSEGWKFRPRNFVGGLHNQAYNVISGRRGNYCLVVEFKPNTAKYFIPEKLDAFKNAVIDINEVWGEKAGILSNRIDNEDSNEGKIDLIEAFLLTCLEPPKDSVVDNALFSIFSANGNINVRQLSQGAYLSLAQFRKRFNEEVGISPSQYCKVVRVNAALNSALRKSVSLTDISYSLGYFDQAHFIKDFKTVVGVSPKKYLSSLA